MKHDSDERSATMMLMIWVGGTTVVVAGFVAAALTLPIPSLHREPEFLSAFGALLGVVFGTAAAIGGAVATVRLASLALAVSQRQDLRDARTFMEDRVTKALDVLADVAVGVSSVVAAAVDVDAKLTKVLADPKIAGDHSRLLQAADQNTSGELRATVITFTRALRRLSDSLRAIQMNTIARRCYLCAQDTHGALQQISGELRSIGIPDSEMLSSDDISSIVQLVDLAAQRLEDPALGWLLRARLETTLPLTQPDLAYDHASLQSLMFAGNLLLARTDKEPSVYAALGAAMLRDTFRRLPSATVVREILRELYSEPGLDAAIQRTVIDFNPAEIAGVGIMAALEELERRRDILVIHIN